MENKWKTFDTAPKDGTKFLGCVLNEEYEKDSFKISYEYIEYLYYDASGELFNLNSGNYTTEKHFSFWTEVPELPSVPQYADKHWVVELNRLREIECKYKILSHNTKNGYVKGWMPIETAPKDGTVIDLWDPAHNQRLSDCYWRSQISGTGVWCRDLGGTKGSNYVPLLGLNPTYWKPIPAAPDLETEE